MGLAGGLEGGLHLGAGLLGRRHPRGPLLLGPLLLLHRLGEHLRERLPGALGLGEPIHVRYLLWLKQFLINEPLHFIEGLTGWDVAGDGQRVISWQTRSPVADILAQRFAAACRRYKLNTTRFEADLTTFRVPARPGDQLSLFDAA